MGDRARLGPMRHGHPGKSWLPVTVSSCRGIGRRELSSASNRAWLGNGCRTAARLGLAPPPRPCRTARHSLGHRLAFASGAGPAMGMVAGPEAPQDQL
jgi:hypothetical protein